MTPGELIGAALPEQEARAELVHREATLEDQRHAEKAAAIVRIATETTQAISGKPHSVTSAESIVETDETYRAFLADLREVTRLRILADAAAWAARQRAELAVRLAGPGGA